MRNPSGIFKRIVKSPLEAVGSPSSTANCAPGRTTGGAGPQGMVSGVNAFVPREWVFAAVEKGWPTQASKPTAAPGKIKYLFMIEAPFLSTETRNHFLSRWIIQSIADIACDSFSYRPKP